jgi:hypothetical protein
MYNKREAGYRPPRRYFSKKGAIIMVQLIIGHKGSGKTKKMVEMANASLDKVNGSVVFINKNQRLMYDLKFRIRVVCMEDFEHVTNIDEYIGFLYGIISQDHDIELIFIDSILQHADVKLEDLEEFLMRLASISEKYGPDFVVSISQDIDALGSYIHQYKILN